LAKCRQFIFVLVKLLTYLTILPNYASYIEANGRKIVNYNVRKMWKEAVMAYLVALTQDLPCRSKENHENTQSGQQSSSQELKQHK
jgi:hypothetical protein